MNNYEMPSDPTAEFADYPTKMPVLFVGHGSPMNAIEDNEFSRAWTDMGKSLPTPKAILCISAHWETGGTKVTAMERPKTIYDFYGFPPELYAVQYPVPGFPGLARFVQGEVRKNSLSLDFNWGLDHGTWSVLNRMFPSANIPVVQLSLDSTKDPAYHYELGRELKALRNKGVLILGSGNMVHNLRLVRWEDGAYDWALEFDEIMKQRILSGDHDAIVHYQQFGRIASLAVPTNEHFLPLLYVLALKEAGEEVSFFADRVTMGSISMRSLTIGTKEG
jgi:4,5-DOPA dioxygenase extradiol